MAELTPFGGSDDFKPLNHKPGNFGTGDSEAAIGEWGGITDGGKLSSIQAHGPVELPSNRTDAPAADDGSRM